MIINRALACGGRGGPRASDLSAGDAPGPLAAPSPARCTTVAARSFLVPSCPRPPQLTRRLPCKGCTCADKGPEVTGQTQWLQLGNGKEPSHPESVNHPGGLFEKISW